MAHAPSALSADQLALLARHRLVRPLVRQMVLAELAAAMPVSDEERQQALEAFMQDQKLEGPESLDSFLRPNLLLFEELLEQVVQPLRLSRYVGQNFMPKAEARFLQRKTQLDRVVYSLLRLENAGLARELFLQINEGESEFSDLAARYAEGPERTTRGIIGPVPLTQSHPALAERLRSARPGVVLEPFRIDKWWLVVRLESYTAASLDEATAQQMARELFEESVEEMVDRQIAQLMPLRYPQS